ncbi:glycoside hydrolase family 28 protein [Sphingomonas hengshuiensis]|uniref:glycoside hydrolase family 28 protein n=1 Tax=Sphingomonas hengshuiensis TaxID=1609977 RepID=UPI0006961F47|nr:glycosyl hydrolase family 28 protein [Sphingomonas hengshuiensis]
MDPTRREALQLASSALLCALPALPALAAPRRRVDIRRHGAVADGASVNTVAIQKTIDACAAAGGGVIVVPRGVFVTGSIVLKPGVGLELSKGAVLKGSANLADYPLVLRRFVEVYPEALRMAMINATGNHGLRITGEGTLDGNGDPFWRKFFTMPEEHVGTTKVYYPFPQIAFIQDCDDVLISGVTFKDAAFWNLHMYRCRRSIIEDCAYEVPHDIRAPSSDAIDLDSCQDITVRRCRFSVDDDCIALKGTQGPAAAGYADAPPVERIHIHDCIFEYGLGCVTFGSNGTVMRDIRVERITNVGDIPTIRFKIRPDTPGQVYERLHVRGVRLAEAPQPVSFWHRGEVFYGYNRPNFSADDPAIGLIVNARLTHGTKVPAKPPGAIIRDVVIEDVKGTTRGFGTISGNATTAISNFTLRDIDVTLTDSTRTKLIAKGVPGLKLENVRVNGKPAEVEA